MKKKRTDVAGIVRRYFQEIATWRGGVDQYSWEEIASELQKRARASMTGAGLRVAFSVECTRQTMVVVPEITKTAKTTTTDKTTEKTIVETPTPRAIPSNHPTPTAAAVPVERVSEHTQRGREALRRGNNLEEL